MSFQHFRLGDISLQQSTPSTSTLYQSSIQPDPGKSLPTSSSHNKQPYGSGDSDDGYTLIFSNLAAFQEWRAAEEERQMVEFVKGDTHGSKAIPPRFKDHTKLVCARHSRSGRKKYVKKYPDRVRKVPSRKLEGVGCPASISYKTYFNSEEVRACYVSQHSHPIGLANLPFTRRGRKAAAQQEKERNRNRAHSDSNDDVSGPQPSVPTEPNTPSQEVPEPTTLQPEPPAPPSESTNVFAPSVAGMSPPVQNSFQPQSTSFVYPGSVATQSFVQPQQNLSHERWENMTTLFHSIRDNARTMEYPATPMNYGPQPPMSSVMQHLAVHARTSVQSDGGGPSGEGTRT